MSEHASALHRGALAALALLTAGLDTGTAWAEPKPVTHCISPTGVDLNERWGVSVPIVAPFCNEVPSGRFWAVANAWFMSTTFEATPAEFVPAGETPLEDFIAKFVAVKLVVDPGTRQQQTYVFPGGDQLGTFSAGTLAAINTVTLGELLPLRVGDHVVESYFLMDALHCDGLGDVVADNCLPAGETFFSSAAFTVVPGHESP